MSVRKRKWVGRDGVAKEAWVADYTDQQGERHIKTFDRKKAAQDYHDGTRVDVLKGIHTAETRSISVSDAADHWLAYVAGEGRERSTLAQYSQHIKHHIVPRIGREKLARLTAPRINAFRDDLLTSLSRPLARKVLASLKSILKDAKRRGNVAQNVAADVSIGADRRGARKLKIGVDIPTPDEIKAILAHADGRWRPLLVVAVFAGLRSSELRGLRWADIALIAKPTAVIHVRQRADRWGEIGNPKSETSDRAVPIGPFVVNTLREWKLACPKGERGLVFPNGIGNVENQSNIVKRGFWPAQTAAGVSVQALDAKGKPRRDEEGQPIVEPKYTGIHALRHFFASWCINRRVDGGLELPIKVVQERLGHASIIMTSDRYGHLFPNRDDSGELAAGERALVS